MSLLRWIDNMNQRIGRIISVLLLVIVAIIMWEVVMRYFFNRPTIWVQETSEQLFAFSFLLGGAYTFQRGGHVKVDVVTRHLSPEKKRFLEIFNSLFFFFFIILFIWKTGEWAWDSTMSLERAHSVWEPYIFPVIIAAPISGFLMFLQGIVRFLRLLKKEIVED
jgi:TRAP-type mannitol/chloroaromatic compound transport system permease small subunit